jgi:pyruvate/2-oxoglutarate dehydrogenase complex dihydrolipoamide dehydrogenase (E3) component
VPPIAGVGIIDDLTNENVFELTAQPASMVVPGCGPTGCELAQAFAALGTAVTLVALGAEDPGLGVGRCPVAFGA